MANLAPTWSSEAQMAAAAAAVPSEAREAPPSQLNRRWTPVDTQILHVFLPAVANCLLLPLVGAIDLFWVGQMGDPLAIAGMGAANQVFNSLYFMISFLPAVVTPRIAHEVSNGRKGAAADFVREALSVASLLGFIGTLALVVFPERVLSLISSDPLILQEAAPYLRFRGLSLIPTLCSTICFATYRGTLDLSTPLKVAVASNLVNVALDPVLMFVLGLGIRGAALASTVSDFVNCTTFVVLLRRLGFIKARPRIPSWKEVGPLLQSGLAVQLRSLALNIMFLYAVRRVTCIDPTGVQAAAYQVTMQFWSLGGYILLGLSTAGSGLVPTWLACEGVDVARQAADRLLVWGAILGVLLGLAQLCALPLVSVITPIPAVREASVVPSIIAAFQQILCGIVFAGEGMLLGLRAYGWLAASSGVGCLLMLGVVSLSGTHVLAGIWVGLLLFNVARLCGSMSHRFRFGPLACPA